MVGHAGERRELAVGQRNDLRAAVAGVLHRAQRALGVAREADAEQHIPRTDAKHLLENLADAVGVHERDIIEQKVEIKAEKVRQCTGRAHAEYVDAVRPRERVHRALKGVAVDFIKGLADHVGVRVQHGAQHVAASQPVARNLHALHRGQLVADHLLKRTLKVRIAVVAKLGRKAHDRGLAHADRHAQTARRHEGRLVIVLENVPRDLLLPLGKTGQFGLYLADKVVHSIISPALFPAFLCYHCKPSCTEMQEPPRKIAELFSAPDFRSAFRAASRIIPRFRRTGPEGRPARPASARAMRRS